MYTHNYMYMYAPALEAISSTVFMAWLWAWLQTHRKRNGYNERNCYNERNGYNERNCYNVLDIKSQVLILEQSEFPDIIMHS